MRVVPIFLATAFLAGCAGYRPAAGARETMKEPLHTEAGIGVTVWKVPVIGVGGWGFGGYSLGGPPVVVNRYDYPSIPPRTSGGMPVEPPPPLMYQTVYPPAPFEDPTLVVMKNTSYRAILWWSIDGGKETILLPGQITADIRVDVGDHTIRYRGEVLTGLGPRQIPERVFPLRIDPRGRAQFIHLSEY